MAVTVVKPRHSKWTHAAGLARPDNASLCAGILEFLCDSPDAAPFLQPVDMTAHPGYSLVITAPMVRVLPRAAWRVCVSVSVIVIISGEVYCVVLAWRWRWWGWCVFVGAYRGALLRVACACARVRACVRE